MVSDVDAPRTQLLAEELGFHQVWAVEHHFLEEYSHCSAPEVFLTAVAAQTQRVRVGHGAAVAIDVLANDDTGDPTASVSPSTSTRQRHPMFSSTSGGVASRRAS